MLRLPPCYWGTLGRKSEGDLSFYDENTGRVRTGYVSGK